MSSRSVSPELAEVKGYFVKLELRVIRVCSSLLFLWFLLAEAVIQIYLLS